MLVHLSRKAQLSIRISTIDQLSNLSSFLITRTRFSIMWRASISQKTTLRPSPSGYIPCNEEGEEGEDNLKDEFLVDDTSELVGLNDLYFKVFVNGAYGLPDHLCNHAFIKYQFKFDKEVYQTDEYEGTTKNPKFNYKRTHKIDTITEAIANELRDGSMSFMVYAYPPQKGSIPKNDGGLAIKRKMTMARGMIDADLEAKALGLDEEEDTDMDNKKAEDTKPAEVQKQKTLEKSAS